MAYSDLEQKEIIHVKQFMALINFDNRYKLPALRQ